MPRLRPSRRDMVCSLLARVHANAGAAMLLTTPGLAAQNSVSEPPLQWGTAVALFPKGAQMALVSGDPTKPGLFTALIAMPDRYLMPPHFHPTDEHVEVKQETFLVGMGDRLDVKKTVPMVVGDTGTAPAGMHHFAIAKGATIISVTAMGPYVLTYVNPEEEPWRPFPYGY